MRCSLSYHINLTCRFLGVSMIGPSHLPQACFFSHPICHLFAKFPYGELNQIFFGNVSKIRAFEILVSTLSSAYTVNKTIFFYTKPQERLHVTVIFLQISDVYPSTFMFCLQIAVCPPPHITLFSFKTCLKIDFLSSRKIHSTQVIGDTYCNGQP